MAEPGITYCADCDHPHPQTRDEAAPWRWRCLRNPRPSGFGFVHPTYSPNPPYHRCQDVNHGACPDYEPRRGPHEQQQSQGR